MATYIIPECNVAELESRIEKLNRRCARLGVSPITISKKIDHIKHQVRQLTVDGHINLTYRDSIEKVEPVGGAYLANAFEPTGAVMAFWSVEVEGSTPTLNGWSFTAILELMQTEDGETLNLISSLPGESCPEQFRNVIGRCDHCNVNRRRTQTFVVRDASNQYKCVGRQCLKDFLGYHADPQNLASAAELMAELGTLCESAGDEEWLGGGRTVKAWDLTHFLALAACRIRLFGWVSRAKARESMYERISSTADVVVELLTPPGRNAGPEEIKFHKELCEKHIISDEDKATAEAAIEWAKAIPEGERNDYLGNCNLVARTGIAQRKTAGIAASILVAYAKTIEQEINRQKLAARPESNHIGTVGVRIPCLKVTCEKVIMRETDFGVTGIHKLVDECGNDLTWFASAGAVIQEGETVFIAAGVKSHDEFKGRKQTVLTRVTVLTDEYAAGVMEKAAKKSAREAKKAK